MADYTILVPYVLAIIAGISVKYVDWIDDDKKGKNPMKWPAAVLYGALIGYLIGTASFSSMFIAALFAQVFSKKVDTKAHMLGFLVAVLSTAYFGIPPIQQEYAFFVYFMVLAFLDEVDFLGGLRPVSDYRPFMKLGALLMAMLGRWDFFVGIIAFDLGYGLVAYAAQKKILK